MPTINYTNFTGFSDLLHAPNTATAGTFWIATLYLLFVVLAVVMSRQSFTRGVLASAGVCLVIGIFMTYLDLVNYLWIAPFFAIILITILYTIFTQNQ